LGYDVYITRRTNWWQPSGQDIDLAEWSALAAQSADLVPWQGVGPDGLSRQDPTLLALRLPEGGQSAPFLLNDGQLVVKSPDDWTARRMGELAEALGAKVQGEDGEIYDRQGNMIAGPVERDEEAEFWDED